MSASAEFQKLVHDTIRGDSAVMALLGDFYDVVPKEPFKGRTAYGSFGPSDVVDESADCISMGTHNLQLDVWSIAVGQVEAKRITDRLYRLFHDQDLVLTDNALVRISVQTRRVMPDRDPKITHGIVTLSATIEEPE
ncbi:DUF3168 domain-containing protein [Rhizobium sp. AAP43]|uniref:DUF3168 domain-containing protein n=1 Tax=Rhizobium sp. AAP43 TaxID=1523420 RepID=UPI0006BA04B1|nr:DUF3168 domain-containing protein [Rhizobium sp. AAP43]KPF47069.1 hypothetical protein IP76_01850 [Rhizobium sp. AAP43]